MNKSISIVLNGKSYTWNGTSWYETQSFTRPSEAILRQLNARLAQEFQKDDTSVTNIQELLKRASQARDTKQYHRAEMLTRRVLERDREHIGALTILCSVLRARGRAQEALDATDAYRDTSYGPLLTSRAAAYCDLQRWEEAKREIGRALAIQATEEAWSVIHRIKAARPDLYQ